MGDPAGLQFSPFGGDRRGSLGVELEPEVTAEPERRRSRPGSGPARRLRGGARAGRSGSAATAPRGSRRDRALDSIQPTCPGSDGPTVPPAALASAWPPKQSPRIGTSASSARRRKSTSDSTQSGASRDPGVCSEPSEQTQPYSAGSAGSSSVPDAADGEWDVAALAPIREARGRPVFAVLEDQAGSSLGSHRARLEPAERLDRGAAAPPRGDASRAAGRAGQVPPERSRRVRPRLPPRSPRSGSGRWRRRPPRSRSAPRPPGLSRSAPSAGAPRWRARPGSRRPAGCRAPAPRPARSRRGGREGSDPIAPVRRRGWERPAHRSRRGSGPCSRTRALRRRPASVPPSRRGLRQRCRAGRRRAARPPGAASRARAPTGCRARTVR